MTESTKRFLKSPWAPAAVMAFAFLVSAAFILFIGNNPKRYVLFFPENSSGKFEAELRALPPRGDRIASLEFFVDELLLGPVSLPLSVAVPSGTSVEKLILDGKTLHLDLSPEMIQADAAMPVGFDEALNNIRRNITFNFRKIETVNITIRGQIPNTTFFPNNDRKR